MIYIILMSFGVTELFSMLSGECHIEDGYHKFEFETRNRLATSTLEYILVNRYTTCAGVLIR